MTKTLNDLKDNLKEKNYHSLLLTLLTLNQAAFIADQEVLVTYKNGETATDIQK